jgi:hypothetical protein
MPYATFSIHASVGHASAYGDRYIPQAAFPRGAPPTSALMAVAVLSGLKKFRRWNIISYAMERGIYQ